MEAWTLRALGPLSAFRAIGSFRALRAFGATLDGTHFLLRDALRRFGSGGLIAGIPAIRSTTFLAAAAAARTAGYAVRIAPTLLTERGGKAGGDACGFGTFVGRRSRLRLFTGIRWRGELERFRERFPRFTEFLGWQFAVLLNGFGIFCDGFGGFRLLVLFGKGLVGRFLDSLGQFCRRQLGWHLELGFGFRFDFTSNWEFGLEFCYRLGFYDYLGFCLGRSFGYAIGLRFDGERLVLRGLDCFRLFHDVRR